MKGDDHTVAEGQVSLLLAVKSHHGRDGHSRLMLEHGTPFPCLLIPKDVRGSQHLKEGLQK